MTDPMTTTTAQATVLTEEQLANIESTLDTYVQHHRKVDTEWARTMAMNVVRSHRALTEQVRVLEQRRGCRRPATGYTDLATPECEWHEDVEMLITAIEDAHAKVFPEWGELDGDESGVYLMTQALQRITDTALAALEGSGE